MTSEHWGIKYTENKKWVEIFRKFNFIHIKKLNAMQNCNLRLFPSYLPFRSQDLISNSPYYKILMMLNRRIWYWIN